MRRLLCRLRRQVSLAFWYIRFYLGAEWIDLFLRAYGIERADERRVYFCRLLDKFF